MFRDAANMWELLLALWVIFFSVSSIISKKNIAWWMGFAASQTADAHGTVAATMDCAAADTPVSRAAVILSLLLGS